jgi:hypothetical protein
MRQICHEHCPGGSGHGLVLLVVAALGVLAAVALFVVTHVWVVLGGAVLTIAGAYSFQCLLQRWTVLEMPHRGPAISRAALPAPAPARALSAPRAPRAIEAPRRVIRAEVISEAATRRER